MHILYLLEFSNGKIYIGQTVRTMQTRLSQHRQLSRNGSNLPVHCAWRVHGEPIVTILAEFNSIEDLHLAEIATIKALNSISPNGYNLGYGGETAPSKNPEVAKKISESAKGRRYSDTTPWAKASLANWEKEDYREKVSNGLKAGWTEERRESARKRILDMWAKRKEEGWVMPESQKQRLRDKVVTDDAKSKMSESAKTRPRKPFTDATKEKLSKATKESWANHDNSKRVASIKESWDKKDRSEISEKAKNSWKDPEIRQKRIAAIKAAKLKKR